MSLQDILGMRVERGFLLNLDTNRRMDFLFNPTELEETYTPKYVRVEPHGLPHEILHFTGCRNASIPLTLYFDQVEYDVRRSGAQPDRVASVRRALEKIKGRVGPTREVEQWRNFLISLVAPRKSQRLGSQSPPPVLFYWPELIAMRVRVVSLSFKHMLFEVGTAKPRIFTAQVGLEEEPQERMHSEDIPRLGTLRPWAVNLLPRGRR